MYLIFDVARQRKREKLLEVKRQEEKQQKAEEKQLRKRIWEETRAQLEADAEKEDLETDSEGKFV